MLAFILFFSGEPGLSEDLHMLVHGASFDVPAFLAISAQSLVPEPHLQVVHE